MFVPSRALATNDNRFIYVPAVDGTWEAYINYDLARDSLPSRRIDFTAWENAQLNAKIELLNYLRKH